MDTIRKIVPPRLFQQSGGLTNHCIGVTDMGNNTNTSTLTIQGFTPYAQVPRWVLRAGDKLSNGAVRLYGVIMSYADNSDHAAFPSRETLSKDLGVKEWSISKYIKELENYGALIVDRRRNKRTGNFYANHYTLVFEDPCVKKQTPPDVPEHPITKPTILTTLTSFTSEQSPELSVSPATSSRSRQNASKAELADPISPAFYHSEDRQILLQNIRSIAQAQIVHGIGSPQSGDMIEVLQNNLETAFGSDCMDELDGMIYDYAWVPKRTHVDKKNAAIWLNQLLHEWSNLSGGIAWRGEHVSYVD